MSKMESDLTSYDQNTDLEIKEIEYDPGMLNSQRAINVALSEGLTVRLPEANELLIDIDNEHSFMLYQKQIDIVDKYIGLGAPWQCTPSRHGLPGRHIVVTLDHDITETERLLLQACLGSDRVRELLGYVQMKNGDAHPSLFLESKANTKLLTE